MKYIVKYILPITLLALYRFSFAQQASSVNDLNKHLQKRQASVQASWVKNVPFECIGPTVMSGRVVDIEVNAENPRRFYVAYASGGLWYTENNGTSFKAVMDAAPTQNIGEIAVDWKNNTIWVGTGENNSSRSSYSGIGILKSSDGGKTWNNMGLHDSHHIGGIVINPNKPDEVVVAALGHLYSPNPQRGIFKTTDGGKTWSKTLYINDSTGIIDIKHAPNNFNIMIATSWEKDRKAWHFKGSGVSSGVYKSTDAGNSWTKISLSKNGLPNGDGVGRMGVAMFDEQTYYLIHDSQFRREKEKEEEKEHLEKDDFKSMSKGDFLALDDEKLNKFLKSNNFPKKYTAPKVKSLVKEGKARVLDIARYLESANTLLFDTPVTGAEIYRSDNGGKTWKKTHKGYIDDVYFSYGYYFGRISVHPTNKDKIYFGGVPLLKSEDGGKTFESISAKNVHSDHHFVWVSPENHIINGNDGGVNMSYDDGASWVKCNTPTVGQFYSVNVDNRKNYRVYGGLQDNGVWMGPNDYKTSVAWHQSGHYPYTSIMGGDGMQVEIDKRNPDLVYTGYQFGNYFRINTSTKERKYIQPKHSLGEEPYRFNWQTPIHLSAHNNDILYLGSNKLHRSMDKGNTWASISEDLTQGGRKGNVAYGTLTSISESPFAFGLIYVGSDDGIVSLTQDGGSTWKNLSEYLPKNPNNANNLWVSRVIASMHKKERVYLALNGYRWDDFDAYVYVSDDYGQIWKSISTSLPASPVNVIKEDYKNENVLYVGTDNGIYVSFDRGQTWHVFDEGLTYAAVHDLVLHPTANDLIVATHGRSLYKADISPLQTAHDTIWSKDIYLFPISKVRHNKSWGSAWSKWLDAYETEIDFTAYVNKAGTYKVRVTKDNKVLKEWKKDMQKGFNYVTYDMTADNTEPLDTEEAKNGKIYLPKGTYQVQIQIGKKSFAQTLEVE